MTHRVKLTATAEKQHKQLPPQIRARIDAALVGLKTDPRPTGVVKLSGSKSDWQIAHRREAYQP